MEILPGDLGETRALAIIRLRAVIGSGTHGSPAVKAFVQNGGLVDAAAAVRADALNVVVPQKKLRPAGFWTRFWAGGTGLSPEASRSAVTSMRSIIGGLAGGMGGGSMGFLAPATVMLTAAHEPVVAGIFFTLGLTMMGTGLTVPRLMLTGYAKKPLASAEIETLISAENDPTEKAFLRVVAEAVQTPVALLGSAQTEQEIKAALETLGEAIDKLPRVVSPTESAETLRNAARKALVDANNEPDALIAASLRRRAEAQTKTAAAADRSTLILRRADALRREIEAQIDALRMGLSTLDAGQTDAWQNTQSVQNTAAHLSQLAQSIQSVARDAGSLADARDEVDSWTEQTAPVQTAPAPSSSPAGDTSWPARATETAVPDVITVGRTAAR